MFGIDFLLSNRSRIILVFLTLNYNAVLSKTKRHSYYTDGHSKIIDRISHQHSGITYYTNDHVHVHGCYENLCGVNAICQESAGGRPICSCPPGHSGNPLSYCKQGECSDNIDCRNDLQCKDSRCVNPCLGACGINANCEPANHVAVCSCPNKFTGDPFVSCRPVDPEEQCHPSPCGKNTKCEIINDVPTCSCLHSYHGNPLTGCQHECDYDSNCGFKEMCIDFKCISACKQCGIGANCKTISNHRALCECPKGYLGSPYTECKPECYDNSNCPAGKPACINGICTNTCENACGIGADCNFRGATPVCSCPKYMTGNPFVRCIKANLCVPNPCGTNAVCVPGSDNSGRERPVCTCPSGYTGNSLVHCTKGECQSNSECPYDKACINYQCVSPCTEKCAPGAKCEAKAHVAICTCPHGFSGDAVISCRQSRILPVAKYE